MTSPRTAEEQWELLRVTLDLAIGFELILVACATTEVRDKLRARLRHACESEERPFLEPEKGEDGLDWLTRLRGTAPDSEGPLPVLFYPFPLDEDREIFALHRLNENRDNLRSQERGIRGMLVLAGGPKLLRHAAVEAPDLWSVRARSFELTELEVPDDVPLSEPQVPVAEPPVEAEPFRHDVFLSCAYRDRQAGTILRDALKLDGIEEVLTEQDASIDYASAVAESKVLVFALSPDFIHGIWPIVEPLFADDPERISRRSVILMLRPCVPPAALRSSPKLDWTTEQHRRDSYGQLVAAVRRRLSTRTPPKEAPAESEAERQSSPEKPRLRGAQMVARMTEIYDPPTRLRKMVAFVVVSLLLSAAGFRIHDHFTAASAIFPGFGWGTINTTADTGVAKLSSIECNDCSQGVEHGTRLSGKDWTSGNLGLILEKPLGLGSVNLADTVLHEQPNLTIRVQMPPASQNTTAVAFVVVLVDHRERRALYICFDDENKQSSRRFKLNGLPAAFDPSHVKTVGISLPHQSTTKRTTDRGTLPWLDIEGMDTNDHPDAKPCLLAK